MTLRRARRLFGLALFILAVWLAFGVLMVWKRLYLLPGRMPSYELIAEVATHVLSWAAATPLAIYAFTALATRQAIGKRLLSTLLLVAFAPFALVVQAALSASLSSSSYSDVKQSRQCRIAMLYYNLFPLVGIGAATLCARARTVVEEHRRDEVELSTEIARIQLQQLRSDLEPHFLYNALNSIAALIREDPAQAQLTLRQLADLLERTHTWETATAIPLREEVAFLTRYLDIQATRFRDRLTSRVDLPPALKEVLVPPLILQPLVENAVRHGIARFDAPGWIEVRASSNDGLVCLEVRDSGPGFDSGATPGGGIGIANIRARLRLMYGARQSLTFDHDRDGFVAKVVLPERGHAS